MEGQDHILVGEWTIQLPDDCWEETLLESGGMHFQTSVAPV